MRTSLPRYAVLLIAWLCTLTIGNERILIAEGIVQVPISWTALNESTTAMSGLTDLFLIGRASVASRVFTTSNRSDVHLITSTPTSTLGSGFPTFPDPVDGMGLMDAPGDVRRGSGELRQLRRDARQAWQNTFGMAPPGVLGINVNNLLSGGDPPGAGGGIIGLASVAAGLRERGGRWLIVEDVNRLAADAMFQVVLAHEVGHTLGLTHRRFENNGLMFPTVQDLDVDGFFDNRRLTRFQERRANRFARGKPGTFVDPPGVFEPGPLVDAEQLDDVLGVGNREHLDLSIARTFLDAERNVMAFDQELFGLIPHKLTGAKYWTLVDSDNNPSTGASSSMLSQFGVNSAFSGAELLVEVDVNSDGGMVMSNGSAWQFDGNQLVAIQDQQVNFGVHRERVAPIYAEGNIGPELERPIPINDIVFAEIDNSVLQLPFAVGQPFRLQMMIQEAGNQSSHDRLDDQEFGHEFMLQHPDLPAAFVLNPNGTPIRGIARPDDVVSVRAEGLQPNSQVEVYLGHELIDQAVTDNLGNIQKNVSMPCDILAGDYLLSVRNLGTTLSADTVISILGLPGDFNEDGLLEAADIDLMTAIIQGGNHPSEFDLNNDALVDNKDRDFLIQEIMKTHPGDVDLDGAVLDADLQIIFANTVSQGGWSDGDVTGDGIVSNADVNALLPNLGLGPDLFFWNVDSSGTWSSGANWDPNPNLLPNRADMGVVFGDVVTTQTTIQLITDVTVNSIEFDNPEGYTIASQGGDAVSLEGNAQAGPRIDALAGAHEFQVPVNLTHDTVVQVDAGASVSFNDALEPHGHMISKVGGGTLFINDSTSTSSGTIVIANGTLSGTGQVPGNVEVTNGQVAPGMSTGILTVAGDYTHQTGAALAIEIAGTAAGENGHDQLVVAGQAVLDGTLNVELIDPGNGLFTPALDDTFVLLTTSNGIIGTFQDEQLPILDAGLGWELVYSELSVSLIVEIAALAGDFNSDGVVNAADYVVWRDTLGQMGPNLAADGNGDEVVSLGDYGLWKSNYGATAAVGASAIPEPATWVLLTSTLLLSGVLRTDRRARWITLLRSNC